LLSHDSPVAQSESEVQPVPAAPPQVPPLVSQVPLQQSPSDVHASPSAKQPIVDWLPPQLPLSHSPLQHSASSVHEEPSDVQLALLPHVMLVVSHVPLQQSPSDEQPSPSAPHCAGTDELQVFVVASQSPLQHSVES
jgi:hypothetical protein